MNKGLIVLGLIVALLVVGFILYLDLKPRTAAKTETVSIPSYPPIQESPTASAVPPAPQKRVKATPQPEAPVVAQEAAPAPAPGPAPIPAPVVKTYHLSAANSNASMDGRKILLTYAIQNTGDSLVTLSGADVLPVYENEVVPNERFLWRFDSNSIPPGQTAQLSIFLSAAIWSGPKGMTPPEFKQFACTQLKKDHANYTGFRVKLPATTLNVGLPCE